MFPKIVGFPQKSNLFIGFSIIFTIHFWRFSPLFSENIYRWALKTLLAPSCATPRTGRLRTVLPTELQWIYFAARRLKYQILHLPTERFFVWLPEGSQLGGDLPEISLEVLQMNLVMLVPFSDRKKIWGQVGPLIGPGVFFLMYLAFLLDRYKLQGQDFVAWSGMGMRVSPNLKE